jgi:hypothetical protein
MAAAPFEIWLRSAKVVGPEPTRDPMLGGHLRVTVNGVVIADDDDFGLERSAVGLLRTVEEDHDAASPHGQHRIPGLETGRSSKCGGTAAIRRVLGGISRPAALAQRSPVLTDRRAPQQTSRRLIRWTVSSREYLAS